VSARLFKSIRAPNFTSCQNLSIYSYRKATMGSTRMARRAGM
jgi:hypothetical protein